MADHRRDGADPARVPDDGLVFVAVLPDRAAISMRLVAWAAAVVLLIAPESLLGPSFQMSFAAVVALVATYEAARPAFRRLRGEGGLAAPLPRLRRGRAADLAGGGARRPRRSRSTTSTGVAAFGLIANLVAVPVTALWIMPLATCSFLLVPFGLESLALAPMGWGVDVVIAVARHVASWPGAALHVPEIPAAALALIAFGGLWLALWRTRLRLAGAAIVAAGIVLALAAPAARRAGRGRCAQLRRARHRRELGVRRRAARHFRARGVAAPRRPR